VEDVMANCTDCDRLGAEIDKLVEQRQDLLRDNDLQRKFIQEWKVALDRALKALANSTIRLGICLGRFRACAEERPGEHAVSLLEIPSWIEDQAELVDDIRNPGPMEVDRRCLKLVLGSDVSDRVKGQARRLFEERYNETVEGGPILDRSKTRSA
jgi:hypothetical protein